MLSYKDPQLGSGSLNYQERISPIMLWRGVHITVLPGCRAIILHEITNGSVVQVLTIT
jgi:hypothetical protein